MRDSERGPLSFSARCTIPQTCASTYAVVQVPRREWRTMPARWTDPLRRVGPAWTYPGGIDPERVRHGCPLTTTPQPASTHLTPLSLPYNFFQYPFHTTPLLLQKQKTLHA